MLSWGFDNFVTLFQTRIFLSPAHQDGQAYSGSSLHLGSLRWFATLWGEYLDRISRKKVDDLVKASQSILSHYQRLVLPQSGICGTSEPYTCRRHHSKELVALSE